MAYSNPIPELEELLDDIGEESEADYVQMKEVYFAFIDVLGFKKLLMILKFPKLSIVQTNIVRFSIITLLL